MPFRINPRIMSSPIPVVIFSNTNKTNNFYPKINPEKAPISSSPLVKLKAEIKERGAHPNNNKPFIFYTLIPKPFQSNILLQKYQAKENRMNTLRKTGGEGVTTARTALKFEPCTKTSKCP